MRGRLISGLLVVLGLALVVWGVGGAFGWLPSPFVNSQTDPAALNEASGEGYIPYSVPVNLENSHTIMAPADSAEALRTSTVAGIQDGNPQDRGGLDGTAASPGSSLADTIPAEAPQRIVIPAIKLDAPVVIAKVHKTWLAAKQYDQWLAPDEFAAGWHPTSAKLGENSNTVLIGHHNVYGQIFRHLVDLNVGDTIEVYGVSHIFRFKVVNKMILPERDASPDQRLENARWILPSYDQRLTLVTCWPFTSNTHRLILVAGPVGLSAIPGQNAINN